MIVQADDAALTASVNIPCEGPVEIRAFDAATSRKPSVLRILAYNGDKLILNGFDAPVVVDLATATFPKNVRINLDHSNEKRVGHVTKISNDGKQLILDGVASAATPFRDEVIRSSADEYQWEASIQARITKLEWIAAGGTAFVNGRTIDGPAYIARAADIHSVALVSLGADRETSVQVDDDARLVAKAYARFVDCIAHDKPYPPVGQELFAEFLDAAGKSGDEFERDVIAACRAGF